MKFDSIRPRLNLLSMQSARQIDHFVTENKLFKVINQFAWNMKYTADIDS